MSGHSKWATIKHKKGAADAKRGKLFAKLIRQLEIAARGGGGDLDSNPTLRTMYQKARDTTRSHDRRTSRAGEDQRSQSCQKERNNRSSGAPSLGLNFHTNLLVDVVVDHERAARAIPAAKRVTPAELPDGHAGPPKPRR